MSRGAASRLGLTVLVAAVLCGCGDDGSTVTTPRALSDTEAIKRTARTWAEDRDCSLISVAYAIRLGDGSASEGRAVCDSEYATVSGRSGFHVSDVTVNGDSAIAVVLTPNEREVTYPLTRDGAGRWRIDGDPIVENCRRVGQTRGDELDLCSGTDGSAGIFVVTDPVGQRSVVDVDPPFPVRTGSEPVGHWEWAALSPDGKTVLAQWSAECEIPYAFLFPVAGGKPHSVTGEGVENIPESIALGWTTDGRGIVFVPREPGCGSGDGPGLYLISLRGARTLIAPAKSSSPPQGLRRSLRPRSVAAVRRAARAS